MVRSTTLYLVALSVSAAFAVSSSSSTHHQLANRRRHHSNKSTSNRSSRSVGGTQKKKRCAAAPPPSGNNSTSTDSGDDSGSGDSGDDSGSSDSGSSGSGSSISSTTSSTAPKPTASTSSNNDGGSSGNSTGSSDNSGNGGGNGVLPATSNAIAGWTTVQDLPSSIKNVQTFTLSDSTLILKNEMKALAHPVVQEDGEPAMHIHYNKGSYDLKTSPASIIGGFSFYTPGPGKSGSSSTPAVDLAALKAREVSFGYSAKFSSGFDFHNGGKMPGLMGGTTWDAAITASGGNHVDNAWSTRMMFRPDGKGELYMYIPPDKNRANLCGSKGTGQCAGPDAGNGKIYGASVGTGNFYWKAGEWTSIRQDIYLNTPGKSDGWAKVYVNGASTPSITITDIVYGEAGNLFWGQQMQSFFGGHDTSWANDHAEDLWLKDFSVVVLSVQD